MKRLAASKKQLILLLLLFVVPGSLSYPGSMSPPNTSYRYLKNYSPEDYECHRQNWAILQDRRGVIYTANQGGLLEYDGVSWRDFKIPNLTVRSLALDDSDTLYVGGVNEIGYITPTPDGSLHYISLLEHLDEKERNFSYVWKSHNTKEGIYFRASKFLFRWHRASRHMKNWQPLTPNSRFYGSFVCGGELFIRHQNIGLMKMVNNSLQLVPGGEIFAAKGIYAMFPYEKQQLVIGTRTDGLFLFDGKKVLPFPTEVDDYLKEKQLSYGIRLTSSPGDLALTTLRGGLVIIDSQGRLKEIFTKASGLQDDNVKYVFEDSMGNLWLALDNGVSRIEYTSPISIYDQRSNLLGIVHSVTRHGTHKNLYVGTSRGLYYLKTTQGSKFQLVPGMSGMCYALLSTGESLLTATTTGLFQLDIKNKGPIYRKVIEAPAYFLLRSSQEPNRIWVSTSHGLFSLYQEKGLWVEERKIENITDEYATIVEDKKGDLWLGTLTKGVIRIDFIGGKPGETIPDFVGSRYNTSHGLPPGDVDTFSAAGHTIFATAKGIFRFDEKKCRFIPDYTLGKEFADGSRDMYYITEGNNKNIWFHSKFKSFQAIPQPDGTFVINSKPFLRFPHAQVNAIYPDPLNEGAIIWFATNEGLIRYDKTLIKNYHQEFQALIRKVLKINDKSVIFAGHPTNDALKGVGIGLPIPVFDYKDRNLRFEYAAPFFEDESSTRYGVFLEGNDDNWSDWTKETKKDYTNLDAGTYTFRIRAKNVYGHLSKEDVFQFKILPPWYQTWWAYLVYVFLFFLAVYFIVRWRSGKLVREKQRLEQIIKDRTREIQDKSRQLEKQSEQLKELDKAKSRFLANISHEFRTPLTLIMGPLEQVLSDHKDKGLEENIHLALRNSQRLLILINQLLDLSKLESGRMKMQASMQNVIPFLKGLVGSFESLAVQNKLDLTFHAKGEEIIIYYDPEKLEKVVTNLVANAVKFTPARGKISINAEAHPTKEEHFPCGYLEIRVRDTGIGIPADQLPYIFDRFYQADGIFSHEQKHKGSGIGLALVKELVELHYGEVSVQSTEGKGTEFILRLPLGADHLKPEEIADADESPPAAREICKIPRYDTTEPVETEQEIENRGEDEEKISSEDMEENVILVVEDNPDVRKYIRNPLEDHYKVVEAADGREGIDKARKIIPDLIVSDIMMPNADGYELCNVLKKDVKTSHIPIVLLTAKASEESIIEGLETGADDYITKPFNTKILLTRIKNLIDLRRGLQEKIQREMVLQPSEIAVSSVDQEFMKELKEAIEKNMSEEEFGVDELAKVLFMSRATLNRKIRAITGESTNRFIQSYRLKRAAQLLKANFGNVTEVSFEVGFSSSTYFTKCFREKFHQLPHAYQAAEAE